MRLRVRGLLAAAAALMAVQAAAVAPARADTAPHQARTPVQHFVFLMQGDRSFDNYFGTYPGADGIPADTCQPLAQSNRNDGSSSCVRPYELHGTAPAPLAPSTSLIQREWNQGRMNGFASAFTSQGRSGTLAMGHYDARDLPFSWSTASQYVLFDRFFAAAPYGTRLNRSFWVSATGSGTGTTVFDRLQAATVSWKFYIQDYNPKETYHLAAKGRPVPQTARVPLLDYPRFVDDPTLRGHLADLEDYYQDLRNGTLPAVSFIASDTAAERTARSIPAGQTLIRNLLTQLQLSSAWPSSAFLWSYDGPGGWYDHVAPPTAADGARLGFRVPTLLVSPYARQGVVDHTVLDSSAALAFVERNWNLAPLAVRDKASPGLLSAFDFTAPPRRAALVPTGAPAPHPALVDTSVIYWCYGGVSVLVALALLAAFAAAARSRARAARVEVGP